MNLVELIVLIVALIMGVSTIAFIVTKTVKIIIIRKYGTLIEGTIVII